MLCPSPSVRALLLYSSRCTAPDMAISARTREKRERLLVMDLKMDDGVTHGVRCQWAVDF